MRVSEAAVANGGGGAAARAGGGAAASLSSGTKLTTISEPLRRIVTLNAPLGDE